ncbi:MAG: InlB B-repeat-containing protein, partial [Verrucomicrobiia bacterium]
QPYYATDPGGGTAYPFINSLGQTYYLYYSSNPYVPVGATVYLQATPTTGYYFSGWSGDVNGTTNPIAVTASADLNVTANFKLLTYSVSTEIIGDGNLSGIGTYTYGSQVSLEANNSTSNTFLGWDTNNTSDGNWSASTYGYNLDESKQVSATVYNNIYYKAFKE